jgi:hypothetical protein
VAAAPSPSLPNQPLKLGELLADAVGGVVHAQRRLDTDALNRVVRFAQTPQGELVLPPLWYTFSAVQLELELAAVSSRLQDGTPQLVCRLLNPTAVSLFGHAASSGLRVSVQLGPREAVPLAPLPPAG